MTPANSQAMNDPWGAPPSRRGITFVQAGLALLVAATLVAFSVVALQTGFADRRNDRVEARGADGSPPRPVVLPDVEGPGDRGRSVTEVPPSEEPSTVDDAVLGNRLERDTDVDTDPSRPRGRGPEDNRGRGDDDPWNRDDDDDDGEDRHDDDDDDDQRSDRSRSDRSLHSRSGSRRAAKHSSDERSDDATRQRVDDASRDEHSRSGSGKGSNDRSHSRANGSRHSGSHEAGSRDD